MFQSNPVRSGADVQSFDGCLHELRNTGHAWTVPEDIPIHGVGHSNGALMHLFIGSLFKEAVSSNVLMSYNNKEVADAIPIPGACLPTRSRVRLLPPSHMRTL
jgi:hypothetical protein